ncbi:MAG: hypothetical protein AB1521_16600 [Bacteroidota bacterium]
MSKPKYFLLLLLLFSFNELFFAQSFTYTGPTSVTVPYGSNTAYGTYYFTYYNLDGEHHVVDPALMISVDGDVICNYSLCDNPQTPPGYTIYFTPGVHTVTFKLLSVNWYTLNCYDLNCTQLVGQKNDII